MGLSVHSSSGTAPHMLSTFGNPDVRGNTSTSQNLRAPGAAGAQYTAGQDGAGGVGGSDSIPGVSNLTMGGQQKLKASAMNLLKHIVQESDASLPTDVKKNLLESVGLNSAAVDDLLANASKTGTLDTKIGNAIDKIAQNSPDKIQQVLENLNDGLKKIVGDLKRNPPTLSPTDQDKFNQLQADFDEAQKALDGMKNQINGSSDSVINNLNMGVMMNEMSTMVEIAKQFIKLVGQSTDAIGKGI